ncbi:Hypothetical protein Nlim_1810 [Candidatus Nitrosarchaeum limnium SFB1]|uniref:Uncharacterized protein n=1 Tax=Candidatus Nitrosarchaeum limnium SFB1 TaxID=886738 RepID=F3KMQ9_9ARCH|nr:Hypothetical protein Nlim_1810 [Candidatus Nitrosarchaeum limnium SFB1]
MISEVKRLTHVLKDKWFEKFVLHTIYWGINFLQLFPLDLHLEHSPNSPTLGRCLDGSRKSCFICIKPG